MVGRTSTLASLAFTLIALGLVAEAPAALLAAPLLAIALTMVEAFAWRSAAADDDDARSPTPSPASALLLVAIAGWWQLTGNAGLAVMLGIGFCLLRASESLHYLIMTPSRRPSCQLAVVAGLTFFALSPHVLKAHRLQGDEPYYLLIAESLRSDGDIVLYNNYDQQDSLRFHDQAIAPQHEDPGNGARSRHDPLLSIILLPGYAVLGRLGAMLTINILAAAMVGVVSAVGGRWSGSVRAGLAAGAIAALSAPTLIYAFQIWTEPAAGLLALLLFAESLREPSPRPLRLGLWAVLLTLLKIRFGLIAAPLIALALLRSGTIRAHLVRIALPFTALVIAVFAWNQWHYGSPFRLHPVQVLWLDLGYIPTGLAGVLFDHAYGLLPVAPHTVLAALGLGILLGSRHRAVTHFGCACAPYLYVLTQRPSWFGEWSPPARYVFVLWVLALPFLAPALVAVRGFTTRAIALASIAWSTLLGIVYVVQPGLGYSVYDGTSQLANHFSIALRADVVRFLPSYKTPGWLEWSCAGLGAALIATLVARGLRGIDQPTRDRNSWLASVPLAASLVVVPFALVGLLARTLPTTIVEFERREVEHDGGRPEPDLYSHARATLPRTGWLHPPRTQSRAPVNLKAGDYTVVVAAKSMDDKPARAELVFGSQRLPLTVTGDWSEIRLPLRIGEPLREMVVHNTGDTDLVIDSVRFRPRTAIGD